MLYFFRLSLTWHDIPNTSLVGERSPQSPETLYRFIYVCKVGVKDPGRGSPMNFGWGGGIWKKNSFFVSDWLT